MAIRKFRDPFQKSNSPKLVGGDVFRERITKHKLETQSKPTTSLTIPSGPPPAQVPISQNIVSDIPKPAKRYDRETLKNGWNQLGGKAMAYLLTEIDEKGTTRFDLLLAESKLKDIMVGLGITTEKVLLMEGQPTQIVGHAEAKKLDELMPALLAEVKRRGVTVKLTERKAEVGLDKE